MNSLRLIGSPQLIQHKDLIINHLSRIYPAYAGAFIIKEESGQHCEQPKIVANKQRNLLDLPSGRRPQARALDCCEHSGCAAPKESRRPRGEPTESPNDVTDFKRGHLGRTYHASH